MSRLPEHLGKAEEAFPETSIHSFVIKIYLDGDPGGGATWRGRITHIGNDASRQVDDLDEIVDFLVRHLAELGVRPTVGWRLRRWLRRRL